MTKRLPGPTNQRGGVDARREYLEQFAMLPREEKERHLIFALTRLLAVCSSEASNEALAPADLSALAKGAIKCDYELGDGGAA